MDILEEALSISDEVTDWKILDKLLDKSDVEMKTEINNPLALTRLRCLALEFKRRNMPKAGAILDDFCDKYMLHMVSYKRKRSREIIEGFCEIMAHNERMKQPDHWLMGGDRKQ